MVAKVLLFFYEGLQLMAKPNYKRHPWPHCQLNMQEQHKAQE